MLDVETAVLDSVREIFPEQVVKIRLETALQELSLDSLDMLELKMRLEEKLDIGLEVDVFDSAPTLGSLASNIVASLQRLSDARY
jgi:acyl carrier protein